MSGRVLGCLLLAAMTAAANHQVMVEGNCGSAQRRVTPGACGDYDFDGRIGVEEDEDGDRVYGTIRAALAAIAQNGLVLIVSSGTFAESVSVGAGAGNLTIEAAQGVTANLDAALEGDDASTARQGQTGITIESPQPRHVIIRNIGVRNWSSGIRIQGNSRVSIESVRLDNNSNYGIEVRGNARASVDSSQINATGYRLSGAGDFPPGLQPNPGAGVAFSDNATGSVSRTTVVRSWGPGVVSTSNRTVRVRDSQLFDNAPDLEGVVGESGGGRLVY